MKKRFFLLCTCVMLLSSILMPNLQAFANDGGVLEYRYVCTTDGFLNLRTVDNSKSDDTIIKALPDCTLLQVWYYNEKGTWMYASCTVGNQYYTGWAYKNGTKLSYEAARDNAGRKISWTRYVDSLDGYIHLRREPTTENHNVLTTVPNNAELYISRKTDKNWGLTVYNGYTGWVYLGELTEINPAAPTISPENTPAPSIAPDTYLEETELKDVPQTNPAIRSNLSFLVLAGIAVLILIMLVIVLIIIMVRKSNTAKQASAYYYPQQGGQYPPQQGGFYQSNQGSCYPPQQGGYSTAQQDGYYPEYQDASTQQQNGYANEEAVSPAYENTVYPEATPSEQESDDVVF